MRSSEKMLLWILVGMAAIGAVLILGMEHNRKVKALDSEYEDLELLLAESESVLADRDVWLERGNWLAKVQPPFDPEQQKEIQTDLIDTVDKAARESSIEIRKRLLLPVTNTPDATQIGIDVTGYGSLEGMLKWLYALQSPDKVRAIERIDMRPDPRDPEKVQADLRLIRFYQPGPPETN